MNESEIKATNKKSTPDYDSNPFTLAFNSFGRMFKHNAGWAIAVLVFGFVSWVVQIFSNIVSSLADSEYAGASSQLSSLASTESNIIAGLAIGLFVFVLFVVFILATIVVSTFIGGMFSYVAIQSEKQRSVSFSEAWDATTKRFWRLLSAQILAGLKIFGWTLLLIVPGIIAALRYTLLPYVIMNDPEDAKGAKTSHDATKALVKGRLMEVFGVATVASIIPFVGSLLGLTGNAALFTQLKAYNDANLEKPKVHWLNYLGFMLIGLVLLFILFIAGIILMVAIANG